AELCYANLAHITDYDVWHLGEEPVNVEMVIRTLSQNTEAAQQTIRALAASLNENQVCECGSALEKAIITHPSRIPVVTRNNLALLVDKYLKT
ncbi:MAG: S-methyl-5'-thioadenosine phosphorylase, partial [Chloroflexota bacterium]